MGAILDHRQPGRIADRHQPVHVADMAAHMGKHQRLRPLPGLRSQIVKVYGKPFIHLDKNRHRPHGSNRPRHRGKCECVGQNPVTRPDPQRPQRTAQRIAPRRNGQAVSRAGKAANSSSSSGGFTDFSPTVL
jgi:hypothetical protein